MPTPPVFQYSQNVDVFEEEGCVAKGMIRPSNDWLMRVRNKMQFYTVCNKAINKNGALL